MYYRIIQYTVSRVRPFSRERVIIYSVVDVLLLLVVVDVAAIDDNITMDCFGIVPKRHVDIDLYGVGVVS